MYNTELMKCMRYELDFSKIQRKQKIYVLM